MENQESMSPETEEILKELSVREFRNIDKERNSSRNMPYAFTGLGEVGEELCLYMFPNSYGSASKGGCAFDNKEIDEEGNTVLAREVKMCCLNGSKECINKECKHKKTNGKKHELGHKAPAFQKECIYCHKSEFKLIKDSRCGISVKPHIEWAIEKNILKEYILFTVDYDEQTERINITCWKIMSNNVYFKDYIINQNEKGSGSTCNCVPYSMDFHLSGPIPLFNVDLYKDHHEIHSYNLNNMKPAPIPKYNQNTGQRLQYQFCDGISDPFTHSDEIDYNENIHKFKLKSGKKTCLGKERGKTTRV